MLDTLSNVKTRLGITGTTYDTFLTAQITLISDVIEAYCRRKFNQANWVQTFFRDENPSCGQFNLFHYPVTAISAIEEDGSAIDADTYRLNSKYGTVRGVGGKNFFNAEETIVYYTAGYATVPSPILSVLDSLVLERYNKKISGVDMNFGSDVQSISIPGSISIAFDYSLQNNQRNSAYGTILGSQANILDDWRSERAVIGSGKLEYVEVDT